ncbi:BofC C-terminal domain-containing protein [Ectobacillus ponti]|uniref:BofC C-terminal domain-containing protein n=1 Tax=Ectobacillus ponti TaxID=2961894 RepID=UPI0034D326BF
MKQVLWAVCLLIFYWFFIQAPAAAAPVQMYASPSDPRVTVVMQRMYLDGEVSEEILMRPPATLEKFLWQHRDWQVVDRDDMQIVLQKRVDDISPLLKSGGYFGVSKKGMLQLFRGKPGDHEAIHSFFQIDIRKLKSDRRRELRHGIRVQTKEKYVKVLQELKHYSVEKD